MGDHDPFNDIPGGFTDLNPTDPFNNIPVGFVDAEISEAGAMFDQIKQAAQGSPNDADIRTDAHSALMLHMETGMPTDQAYENLSAFKQLDGGERQNSQTYWQRAWDRARASIIHIASRIPKLRHMAGDRSPERTKQINDLEALAPPVDDLWLKLSPDQQNQYLMYAYAGQRPGPGKFNMWNYLSQEELLRQAQKQFAISPVLMKTAALREYRKDHGLPQDSFAADMVLEAASMLPDVLLNTVATFTVGGVGAGIGAVAGGPPGAAAGFALGTKIGGPVFMAASGMADDYWDFQNMAYTDAQGNAIKMDPDIAAACAIASGVIKAPLLFMQFKTAVGPFYQSFLKSPLYGDAVATVLRQGIRDGYLPKIVQGAVTTGLKEYGKGVAKQTGIGGVLAAEKYLLAELAKELNNRIKGTEFEHDWGTMWPTIADAMVKYAKGFAIIQAFPAAYTTAKRLGEISTLAGQVRAEQAGKAPVLGLPAPEGAAPAEVPAPAPIPAGPATRPLIPEELKPQAVAAMKHLPAPEGAPPEAPSAENIGMLALRTADGKIHVDSTATDFLDVADHLNVDPAQITESGRVVQGRYLDEGQYQTWLEEGAHPEDLPEEAHGRFWEALRKTYPKIPDEQVDALVTLEETRAQALGLTLEEDITQYYQPEIGKEEVPPAGALEQRNPEQRQQIAQKAIAHFGETQDPREAGYIFPDGTLLDFSGKKEPIPANLTIDFDYRKGGRHLDHREIGQIFPVSPEQFEINSWLPVARFQQASGALRYDATSGNGYASVMETPTDAQLQAMVNGWRRSGVSVVYISITDENGYDISSGEFYQPTVEKLKHFFTEKKLVGSRLVYHQPGKGAVSFDPADGKALLYGSQQADFSTGLHEFAHVWRKQIESRDMATLEQWLDIKEHKWSRGNEETFANGLEQYIKENVLPKPWLKELFEKFKEWLKNIYERFAQFHMPEEVKKVYEGLFKTPRERRVSEMFAPFTEEELTPAGLEAKLSSIVQRNVRGLGLNKAEIGSLISLYGTRRGPQAEQLPPGYTGAGLGTTKNRALEYLVRQMKANPARWRSIILQDQIRGLEGRMTEEDKGMLEDYEVLRETLATRVGKKDIDRVVAEIVRSPEEEIKAEPAVAKPKEYLYDENYTGTKPESLPDGRIRIGPKYFTYSKSQQIRMLRDALTSARREARLQTQLATAEERAKGKAKMAAYKQREKTNERIKKLRQLKNEVEKGKIKMAPEYLRPIKKILDQIDLAGLTPSFKSELQEIANYIKNNPDADVGETIPETVMDQLPRLEMKNIKDMTPDEIEALYVGIMHYKKLASDEKWIRYLDKENSYETFRDRASADLPEPKKLKSGIVTSEQTIPDLVKAGLKDAYNAILGLRANHYDFIVEKVAGMHSAMDDLLSWNISACRDAALAYQQKMDARLAEAIKGLDLKKPQEFWSKKETYGKLELSGDERMDLYMHSQNEDNWQSISEAGHAYRFHAVNPDHINRPGIDYEKGALEEHLSHVTNEEKLLCQGIAAMEDQIGKDMAAVFLDVNGWEKEMLENYWHKDTVAWGRKAAMTEEQEMQKLREKQWFRVGIPKGYLKERTGAIVPLYLNGLLYNIRRDIDRAAAYIGFEKGLRAAAKLVYDPVFKNDFIERVGLKTWRLIEEGLKDIAGEMPALTTIERLATKIRYGMTQAYVSLPSFTPLKQLFSLALAPVYVKEGYLARGMLENILNHKGVFDVLKLYSPKFVERTQVGPSRDIAAMMRTAWQKKLVGTIDLTQIRKVIRSAATWAVRKVDINVVASTMHGAMLQVMDEFRAGHLSPEVAKALNLRDENIPRTFDEQMPLAIKYGDYIISRTQDMSLPEHRSAVSRGDWAERFISMFGSSINAQLNLVKRAMIEAHRTKSHSSYIKLAKSLIAVFIVVPLGEAAVAVLADKVFRRKRKKLDFLWDALSSITGNWYILRDIADAVIQKIRGGWGGEVTFPATDFLNLMAKGIYGLIKSFTAETRSKRRKAREQLAMDMTEFISIIGNLPFYNPARWARKLYEKYKK